MALPLLEGHVVPDRDIDIENLQQDVSRLEDEVAELKSENAKLKREAARSLAGIRKQMLPWYEAMKQLFGEMEAVGVEGSPVASSDSRVVNLWHSWQTKVGGKASDCIGALLEHGEMNAVQLRVAMKCHINSVYEATAKLQKLGLVTKNGGKYSLKQL